MRQTEKDRLVQLFGHRIAKAAIVAARDKALKMWLDDSVTMDDAAEYRYAHAVARNKTAVRRGPVVTI
jgi:hypothetical protein